MAEPYSDSGSDTMDFSPSSTSPGTPSVEDTTIGGDSDHVANPATQSNAPSAATMTGSHAQTPKGIPDQANHGTQGQISYGHTTDQKSGTRSSHAPNASRRLKPSYKIGLFTAHNNPGEFTLSPFTRTDYRVSANPSSGADGVGSQVGMTQVELENVKHAINDASDMAQLLYVPLNNRKPGGAAPPTEEYSRRIQRNHKSLIDIAASQDGDPKIAGQTFEVCTDRYGCDQHLVDSENSCFFDKHYPKLSEEQQMEYITAELDASKHARALMVQEISVGKYRDVANYIGSEYDPQDPKWPRILTHDLLQEIHNELASNVVV